ncbi:OmpA family protein [Pseudoxanthomonas kalamensis]|uniref:OmpA family protein n=1 Tax=Pseudoxanthomonas kalamensis TaxID=289483 RepID=UPI001391BA2D|nr:OmpA family protein [Pseudoxanthomonas kalamensis]
MHHRVRIAAFLLPFAIALAAPSTASAQSWLDRLKKIAENAAKSEVEQKVDEQSRKVARCALGDEECIKLARQQGQEVEIYDDGSGAGYSDSAGGAVASVDPGGDHPLITPYQGSKRKERKYDDYNEYYRIVGWKDKVNLTERLEGTLTRLKYNNPKGRSTFEVISNYRNALVAQGFQVDYECVKRENCGTTGSTTKGSPGWGEINGMNLGIGGDVRYFTGRVGYGGGTAYVSVGVNPSIAYVHVLESAAMDTGMVGVSADALAAGLAASGKVTLDGIFFDTGKASLKAESDASLEQVVILMGQQPQLKLLVVGHTDSTGNAATNMKLSQQRADSVRKALIAQGVAATRLSAQGVGSSVPVASNDTEDGRAQNRRVELVKQ